MHWFIDGEERTQRTLLSNRLEDYVSEENPVRVKSGRRRRSVSRASAARPQNFVTSQRKN